MIVRINQLELARAEDEAGWSPLGLMGPIRYAWPSDSRAFELLVLEQDEQSRPLDKRFRQDQLRRLLPRALTALREAGEVLVLRLDGPIASGELLTAFSYLTESSGHGRFAFSEAQKLEPYPASIISSVRIQPSQQLLESLSEDRQIGLASSVRLRVFSVPERLVNPLLDVSSTDDERWSEILSHSGFCLTTVRGFLSFQIITRRLDPGQIRARLADRLALG